MNIDANCRAMQHLLVQGFTLYTCPAAVCVRRGAPAVLNTHAWAVMLDNTSGPWLEQLLDSDEMKPRFLDAATGAPRVLCHYEGTFLAMDLDVDQVRHARARLEVAKNLSVEPPSIEGLPAIPQDVLEQELKRRKRELKEEEVPTQD